MKRSIIYNPIPHLITNIFLILALLYTFPIGFYSLLRVSICGTCIYYAYITYRFKHYHWSLIFTFFALMFNFLFPFAFGKILWKLFDCILLSIMIYFAYTNKK